MAVDGSAQVMQLAVARMRGIRGNVLLLPTLGIALVLFLLLLGLYWTTQFYASYLFELQYERGWIPYFMSFFFCLSLAILILKALAQRQERAIFEKDYVAQFVSAQPEEELALTTTRSNDLLAVDELDASRYILASRLRKGLQRYRNTRSVAEVEGLLKNLSELDRDSVEQSYAITHFLTWLIPILGFMGTVVGIGLAIGQFKSVLAPGAGSVMEAVRGHIELITAALALAFDTTLLALAYAALIKFCATLLRGQDDEFLTQVDSFCVEKLLNRLKSKLISATPTEGGEVAQGVKQVVALLDQLVKQAGSGGGAEVGRIASAVEAIRQSLTEGQEQQQQLLAVLREIAQELHVSRDVVLAATDLRQLLGELETVVRQVPASLTRLEGQLMGLGQLTAEIYGRTWPQPK